MAILIAVVILLILYCVPDARCSEIFDTAVRHYNKGNFQQARRRFEHLLRREPKFWPAHYQLGNTYMKLREFDLARREYQLCMNSADTATSAACKKAIAYIDSTRRFSGASQGASERASSSGNVGTVNSGTVSNARRRNVKAPQNLEDRIIVVSPRFGHPSVDPKTVAMVKRSLTLLPKYARSVLDENHATINIAPNMTDKFPDVLQEIMSKEALELAQAGGRCYGRDVYLYERPLLDDKKGLGALRSQEDMQNQVLHELGHAFDDCLGNFSGSKEVIDLHSLDASDIEPTLRAKLWYFTAPGVKGSMEACAELFSGFAGASGKDTDAVTKSFPRLKRWMEKQLRLVH